MIKPARGVDTVTRIDYLNYPNAPAPNSIEQLPMHESIRLRIKNFLEHGPALAIA
jgi:hypothetical protein